MELIEKRCVFDFEPFTVKGIVLRLLGDRGDEVILVRYLCGLHDLNGRPFRCAPVVGEVEVADGLGEAFDDFSHGRGEIRAVGEDDVDVWLLHSFEGAFQSFDDVLL